MEVTSDAGVDTAPGVERTGADTAPTVQDEDAVASMMRRLAALEAQARVTQEENLRLRQELQLRESTAQSHHFVAQQAALKAAEEVARKASEDAARLRSMPMVGSAVDTRMLNKPECFSGKDADWAQFALLMRAYVGAMSPRMFELLKLAEDPERSIDRVDLEPGDEHLDTQLYFVLTMLVKGNALDKVSLVEQGEGLHLWRLLVDEYEPQWKSRKMALYQSILNFQFSDDVLASLDAFEKAIRQYQAVSKKTVDGEMKAGIVLSNLSKNVSNPGTWSWLNTL